MWSCFRASKIHHLWWREILFVNLPLKELASPKPPIRHPYWHLIIQTETEGVWNLEDEKAATLQRYNSTSAVKGRFWHPLLKNNHGFLVQWMNQDPEGWEKESIILWLAACRELKAIGVPACLLSQPSINWLAFGDVQSGEKQRGTREQAVKQRIAQAPNKWKENMPSLNFIKWIVKRQHYIKYTQALTSTPAQIFPWKHR